ncbi:hypothetical protein [Streptomyces sp. NPDC088733]|uniref:hypothetical protein n=1 Tax=Streptomyces sp. NPDC088733 TaxID=3365880 RepID=UPI00381834D5
MEAEDVMDFLVEHRAPGVTPGYVAEQLLSMSWIVAAGDVARIAEAGPLKECFPSMAADIDAWTARAEPAYERLRKGTFFEFFERGPS